MEDGPVKRNIIYRVAIFSIFTFLIASSVHGTVKTLKDIIKEKFPKSTVVKNKNKLDVAKQIFDEVLKFCKEECTYGKPPENRTEPTLPFEDFPSAKENGKGNFVQCGQLAGGLERLFERAGLGSHVKQVKYDHEVWVKAKFKCFDSNKSQNVFEYQPNTKIENFPASGTLFVNHYFLEGVNMLKGHFYDLTVGEIFKSKEELFVDGGLLKKITIDLSQIGKKFGKFNVIHFFYSDNYVLFPFANPNSAGWEENYQGKNLVSNKAYVAMTYKDFCSIKEKDNDARWKLMKSYFHIKYFSPKNKITSQEIDDFCKKSRVTIIDKFKNLIWKNKK